MENIYTTLTVTVHTQGATFYFMLRHLKCALVGVSVCVRMPDGKRIVPPLLNISLQYNFTPGHSIDMKSDCIRGAHCKTSGRKENPRLRTKLTVMQQTPFVLGDEWFVSYQIPPTRGGSISCAHVRFFLALRSLFCSTVASGCHYNSCRLWLVFGRGICRDDS